MSECMVVVLNGPPGSGKDTLAEGLIQKVREISDLNIVHERFKNTLYRRAHGWLMDRGYSYGEASDIIEMSKLEGRKELPVGFGSQASMSPRGVLIHVSELVIKPSEGKGYFGEALRDRVEALTEPSLVVVSDGGFQEELEPLMERGIPVVVVRLYREGHTFEGDSRGYVEGHLSYVLHNQGTPEEGVYQLSRIIEDASRIFEGMSRKNGAKVH